MARRVKLTIQATPPPVVITTDIMQYNWADLDDMPSDQVFTPQGVNPNFGDEPIGPAFQIGVVMNQAGTFKNLFILGDVPASATNESWELRINNAGTPLQAFTTVGDPTARDLVHTVSVVAGDIMALMYHVSGPANFGTVLGNLTFVPL